ncbi:hypothetical protein WMY93_012920 [Mugilogobius chulae]|uniref:5-hydroxytryptamine receptor 3A-like n=1 Tax=Mugilogobius chulae TaxID=88201 RepID=A0AAW0P209_9GOBI
MSLRGYDDPKSAEGTGPHAAPRSPGFMSPLCRGESCIHTDTVPCSLSHLMKKLLLQFTFACDLNALFTRHRREHISGSLNEIVPSHLAGATPSTPVANRAITKICAKTDGKIAAHIKEWWRRTKPPPSPHLFIYSNGEVEVQNDQVLVSTCRMRVHRFPFDTQSCNLSFKSVIHTVKDIRLVASESSIEATEQSLEVMRTQYEWLFINIKIQNITTFEEQDMVVYTINMRRRPLLYIVNFLCPVLFFVSLDLASFLISHGGGEKLTFKVTVLLAVTVLQLILNEILPSSSDQIPLIATYCIGFFALMLVSLLETIVVMYLMKKDDHPVPHRAEEEEESAGCVTEDTREQGVFRQMFHRDQSSKVSDEAASLEKILDELKHVEQSLVHLSGHHDKPGEWTRFARKSTESSSSSTWQWSPPFWLLFTSSGTWMNKGVEKSNTVYKSEF